MSYEPYFNEDSTWIIVYPCGNRRRLATVEICRGMGYEKGDYDIASRKEFYGDPKGAFEYAQELAAKYGLILDGDTTYLD